MCAFPYQSRSGTRRPRPHWDPGWAVVTALDAQLETRDFDVRCDIDVQATLKAKLGVDSPRYRILGVCNPRLEYAALQLEERLGGLLACNLIVREAADHKTEVASIDPVHSLERTGNPALKAMAEEVRQLPSEAIAQTY